jgi:tRNA G10  N-methylase Trm11
MIKSTSYSQEEIIKNILTLHCNGQDVDCDPTYSKGVFYRNINKPIHKFDLYPQTEDTIKADCRDLPLEDGDINVLMFDPPFVIGSGPSLTNDVKGQSMIQKRFGGFKSGKDLWNFYTESLSEFSRVIKTGGTLIFKCQDVVGSGKQWFSHIFIANMAGNFGFSLKDLFILNAKNRLISGKIKKQIHARKYHSYFLVFKKQK